MQKYPEEVERLHSLVKEVKEKGERDRRIFIALLIFYHILGIIIGFNILVYLIVYQGWFL